MYREQAEAQLNDCDNYELHDDEFTLAETHELSARIKQLYGDSLEDIAHQLNEYRNA